MQTQMMAECQRYMEETGISQVKLAAKIGIAESTFSRWLKGNYPNAHNVTEKVSIFFGKEKQREKIMSVNQIGFVATGISKEIMGVLEYCRLQRMIGIIYGDAGIGKTFTAKHWAKNKNDIIILEANPTLAGPRAFLKALARKMKLDAKGAIDDIMAEVIDYLDGKDMTVIIDESQHLAIRTLDITRSIHDITGAAIVLIGNQKVHRKMTGKQEAEFAQLFSRIGMPSLNLLTDMFTISDIAGVFRIDETAKEAEYLLKISHSRYGLRGAVNAYINAGANDNSKEAGIRAMASRMQIPV